MQLYNALWIKKLGAIVLLSLPGVGSVFHVAQVSSLPPDKQQRGPWCHESIPCVLSLVCPGDNHCHGLNAWGKAGLSWRSTHPLGFNLAMALCFGTYHPEACFCPSPPVSTQRHPSDPARIPIGCPRWGGCRALTLLLSRCRDPGCRTRHAVGASASHRSQTGWCRAARGAAAGTGHAPRRLPPPRTPPRPQRDRRGRAGPGRVSPALPAPPVCAHLRGAARCSLPGGREPC